MFEYENMDCYLANPYASSDPAIAPGSFIYGDIVAPAHQLLF